MSSTNTTPLLDGPDLEINQQTGDDYHEGGRCMVRMIRKTVAMIILICAIACEFVTLVQLIRFLVDNSVDLDWLGTLGFWAAGWILSLLGVIIAE